MKVAVLFPGFAGRWSGIGKELYDNHRIVQDYFEEASNILGINTTKLCFAPSESDIASMEHAHAALFLISGALFKLLEQQGIKPALLAGHNTGFYASLFAAQTLSFPDGFYLLAKYATIFSQVSAQQNVTIARVLKIERALLETLCLQSSTIDEQVMISIIYTADHHVVVGHTPAVERLIKKIEPHQADFEIVSAVYGWHSYLADGMADLYLPYLEKVDVKEPVQLLISEIDGQLATAAAEIRTLIVALINKPLCFNRILDVLLLHDIIVQIGPGNFLTTVIKSSYPEKRVITLTRQADFDELIELCKPVH